MEVHYAEPSGTLLIPPPPPSEINSPPSPPQHSNMNRPSPPPLPSLQGFNDQEMVALIGAHALGRCHTDRRCVWGVQGVCGFAASGRFSDNRQERYDTSAGSRSVLFCPAIHPYPTLTPLLLSLSGYTNPWTNAPTTFSNLYFQVGGGGQDGGTGDLEGSTGEWAGGTGTEGR